jgi:DinB family protein
MQYLKLSPAERRDRLEGLAAMTAYLEESFGSLCDADLRAPGPDGAFAPVEQVWHLADLEREGFGERIRRLLAEVEPQLPDFEGDRIARERNYRALSFAEGLRSFAAARAANLAAFRSLAPAAWNRGGTQDGVGRVALCDMPELMRRHDESHRAEIEAWKRRRAAS